MEAPTNAVHRFARKALRSEAARADPTLALDIQTAIEGSCVYLESFCCERTNLDVMQRLAKELEQASTTTEAGKEMEGAGNAIVWSQHTKIEDPTFSDIFNGIVQQLGDYFEVDVFATRLNFYRDGKDWKPFHKDSHAFGSNGVKEDFTMGASFGAPRELAFLHEASGIQFSFPQKNGDVFAFDSEVNARFKHGIPKLTRASASASDGPRFSIIAWGRRRRLTSRNSSARDAPQQQQQQKQQQLATSSSHAKHAQQHAHHHSSVDGRRHTETEQTVERKNESVMSGAQVSALVTEHTRNASRLSMRAAAAAVKADIGNLKYRELRAFSHAMQRKEIAVHEYVSNAITLVQGNKTHLFSLVKFMPNNEQLKMEIINALMCA